MAAGSAGWTGGALAGAALGSFAPVVGTTIGGIVGGFVGSVSAGSLSNRAVGKLATFTLGPDDQSFFDDMSTQVLGALQLNYDLNADEYLLVQEALYNSELQRDVVTDRSNAFEVLYVIGKSVLSWNNHLLHIVADAADSQSH